MPGMAGRNGGSRRFPFPTMHPPEGLTVEDTAAIELLTELEAARKEMAEAVEREEKLRQELAAIREILERERLDVERLFSEIDAIKFRISSGTVAAPPDPPSPRLPPCPTIFNGTDWTPDPLAQWNGERWINTSDPELEWNGTKWVGPWEGLSVGEETIDQA